MSIEDLENTLRAHPVVQVALARLQRELSPDLRYHTAAHTDDVLHEALLFGQHDCLSIRETELLAIAAAYHDLGFIDRRTENEGLGAELAVQAMERAGGYTPTEVHAVRVAILDTKVQMLPQGPRQISTSRLSNYLLDADVSNLGRDDFFEKADLVRQELGIPDRTQFLKGLKVFLAAHEWYSPAAHALRSAGKERNRAALEALAVLSS
jgi:predicted metal-dependent HD superfamily phosphohydrolase